MKSRFINNLSLTEVKQENIEKQRVNFCWKDNLSIQRLLDSISSILAEEYISIAKQNPGVFLENAQGKMGQSPQSGDSPYFSQQ